MSKTINNSLEKAIQEQKRGNLAAAEALYKIVIDIDPNHSIANGSLGLIALNKGNFKIAVKFFEIAIKSNPKNPIFYNNIANAMQCLSKYDDAIENYSKSIELKPNYFLGSFNLAITLNLANRYDEAEKIFKEVIKLKPNFAPSYYNLGKTYVHLDRLEEALNCFILAINKDSGYIEAYYSFLQLLQKISFVGPRDDVVNLISKIIEKKIVDLRPLSIFRSINSLLRQDININNVFKENQKKASSISLNEIISGLSKNKLLLSFMKISQFPDIEFEHLFSNIRSLILLNIKKLKKNDEILHFQNSLSSQCFINEYIYNQTNKEEIALKELESIVIDKLNKGEQPSPIFLNCLASYKPLYKYKWSKFIKMSSDITELYNMQILEPEKESKLKPRIPYLKKVSDSISLNVKDQYEDNPYPRWIYPSLPYRSDKIINVTKESRLKIYNEDIFKVENPKILIAGCGTGHQSINSSYKYKNCEVTAIDLSLSSLAYAKRKSDELNISNIKYIQADILDLKLLNKKFDIIECGGVLHHMDDPIVGWEILSDLLKKGGLMKLGLYSESARENITRFRNETKNLRNQITYKELKLHRSEIIKSNKEYHKYFLLSSDFYSLSSFRDFLFHTQEHLFTIPKLKESIENLDLLFCGFHYNLHNDFKKYTGNLDNLHNFDAWYDFEKNYPYVFREMYQFWCQKK